jgi:Iap family predicted aminopeptidase
MTTPGKEMETTVYKLLTGFMSGILVFGVSEWFVFGRHAMTREETQQYISENSPYAKDKGLIEEKLKEDETYWKQELLYQGELDKRLRIFESELQEVRAKLKLPYRRISPEIPMSLDKELKNMDMRVANSVTLQTKK